MPIKSVIFDLDGVLVDTKDFHYYSLNDALKEVDEKYIIDRDTHLSTYDGLSTTKKLQLLTETKGLSPDLYDNIWKRKQEHTFTYIDNMKRDNRIINILSALKNKGYTIYVASNSIYKTIKQILVKTGIIDYIDWFISNEDVIDPKPSPEIYLKSVIRARVGVNETLIIEDSPIGRKAAINSGCHLLAVENSNSYTIEDIVNKISFINKTKDISIPWKGKLNILIPCAGNSKRFFDKGYKVPKLLLDVNGKTMIQKVVENLNCDYETCQFIFVVRNDHCEKYNLIQILKLIVPNCIIIKQEEQLQGAVCSSLLASQYIDNNTPLLFANSDQILDWDVNSFLYSMISDELDGGISTFNEIEGSTKWSYAKVDEKTGFVTEVAEKRRISDLATTGIYYYKHGSDFIKYGKQMMEKNIRVNNEFYVCPVYNEMILDEKKIKVFPVEKMWSLGVPEDLDIYLHHNKE